MTFGPPCSALYSKESRSVALSIFQSVYVSLSVIQLHRLVINVITSPTTEILKDYHSSGCNQGSLLKGTIGIEIWAEWNDSYPNPYINPNTNPSTDPNSNLNL